MKLRVRYSAAVGALLMLTGCATKPIIDTAGLDMQIYAEDMQHCEQVADQVPGDEIVAQSAAAGAVWAATPPNGNATNNMSNTARRTDELGLRPNE